MSTLAEYTVKSPSRGGSVARPREQAPNELWLALLAGGHRVLLHDLHGRGYSDAPAVATYDASLYVTQLALLLQRIGWPRTRLMGVNLDGAIAAAFVATFPDLVENGVVLVAFTGIVESSELSRTAKFTSSPIVQALSTNPVIYVRHLVPPDLLLVISLWQAYPRRLASKSDHRHTTEDALVHELGTADHTVPPAHSSQLKALLANSTSDAAHVELALVPDAGHALTWTHADAVGAPVRAFFAGG
ncbi:Alpha/Beta hydrolase protein [Mycena vulgaris]|nr:Alpha/Beta hydrolase protein [Mycena vulgaris]